MEEQTKENRIKINELVQINNELIKKLSDLESAVAIVKSEVCLLKDLKVAESKAEVPPAEPAAPAAPAPEQPPAEPAKPAEQPAEAPAAPAPEEPAKAE